MKKVKIYKHEYDNPLETDGKTEKPNELLGEFLMTQSMLDGIDCYSYTTYGFKDHDVWKIEGREISGRYGNKNAGTVVSVTRLSEAEDVQKYLELSDIAKGLKYE